MTPASAARETVTDLALALDADDFARAGCHLDAECVYELGDEILRGPEAILSSYEEATKWAHAQLDEVHYESVVEGEEDGTVTVLFLDDIRHGEHRHRHRSRQHFTVGESGKVTHIVHEDPPGEREALLDFFRQCGISPSSGE